METTTETLSVDGVVLNTLAKNIESLTGRFKTPDLRGNNAQVPSRHGSIYSPSKYYDEGQVVLPMWVVGTDDDGEVPYFATERETFQANLDELVRLFRPKNRLLDLRYTLADGSVRQAMCEVREAIDFSITGAVPMGKFSVVLAIPAAFWQDVNTISQTKTIVTSGVNIEFPSFAGATAPMEDLVYTITGPITNPKVLATEDGVTLDPELSFGYTAAITAGQTLTVDSSTWKLTGGGGLVVDYTKFTHKGSPRYMVLGPDALPRVKVTGSALTGASSLSIQGRRKFLVG